MKPAKNTRPSTGADSPAQSTNSYKINRYQQTWHTIEFSNNRHTRHHHNHHSVADRSGATFQTYPVSRLKANQRFRDFRFNWRVPARRRRTNKYAIFRLFIGGRSLFFRFSGGDSNYFTHPESSAQIGLHGAPQAPRRTSPAECGEATRQNGLSRIDFREITDPRAGIR